MEYHPEIYVEMLRKTTKKAQDDQCPGWDWDPELLNTKKECQQFSQEVR
jgi:hypothetical protein